MLRTRQPTRVARNTLHTTTSEAPTDPEERGWDLENRRRRPGTPPVQLRGLPGTIKVVVPNSQPTPTKEQLPETLWPKMEQRPSEPSGRRRGLPPPMHSISASLPASRSLSPRPSISARTVHSAPTSRHMSRTPSTTRLLPETGSRTPMHHINGGARCGSGGVAARLLQTSHRPTLAVMSSRTMAHLGQPSILQPRQRPTMRSQVTAAGILSGVNTPQMDARCTGKEESPGDCNLVRPHLEHATPMWHTHCGGVPQDTKAGATCEDRSREHQTPPRRFARNLSSAKAAARLILPDGSVAASATLVSCRAAEQPTSPVVPTSHSLRVSSAGEKLEHPRPARRPPSVVADAVDARARADEATKAAEAAAVEAEAKARRVLELQGLPTKGLSPEEAWQVVKAPREAKAAAVAAEVALTIAERLVADARAAELDALSQHSNEHVRTFHGTSAVRALTSLSSFVKGERARVLADELSRAEVCSLVQTHSAHPLCPSAVHRRAALAVYAQSATPPSPAHSPRPRA